jgi:hypothetical protein
MTRDPILDGPEEPGGKCGARNRTGGTCQLTAGWGTDHGPADGQPGQGRCRFHGGNTPSGRAYGQKQIAEHEARRFALPIDVDPSTALLEQVHSLAGWVAWLEQRVQADGPDRVITLGLNGETPSPLMGLLLEHRKQLTAVAAAAIRAGVEERRVRLAEKQGDMLVSLIRAILDDLELTPGQRARVGEVVPRHLRSVSGQQSNTA